MAWFWVQVFCNIDSWDIYILYIAYILYIVDIYIYTCILYIINIHDVFIFQFQTPRFFMVNQFFVLRFGRLSGLFFPNSSYATIPKSSPTKSLFSQDLKPQNTPPPLPKKKLTIVVEVATSKTHLFCSLLGLWVHRKNKVGASHWPWNSRCSAVLPGATNHSLDRLSHSIGSDLAIEVQPRGGLG